MMFSLRRTISLAICPELGRRATQQRYLLTDVVSAQITSAARLEAKADQGDCSPREEGEA